MQSASDAEDHETSIGLRRYMRHDHSNTVVRKAGTENKGGESGWRKVEGVRGSVTGVTRG